MIDVSSTASFGCGIGAPWRDLPECYGPYTTCYSRFVRWRRAGIWRRLMDALAVAHDAAVQMIDTTIVRGYISTPPALLETRLSPWAGHEAE